MSNAVHRLAMVWSTSATSSSKRTRASALRLVPSGERSHGVMFVHFVSSSSRRYSLRSLPKQSVTRCEVAWAGP